MFVSIQKQMGLAMGILLGAMGTSTSSSAADDSWVNLCDVMSFAPSSQPAFHRVSHQVNDMQPMLIHDLAGTGATVAVIDTGMPERTSLSETPDGFLRLLAAWDAETAERNTPRVVYRESAGKEAASGESSLVVARAFSVNGATSVQDAIRVVEWVISNKDEYHIGALDLSFIAPTSSTRADDPLHQAVTMAWEAEIVVVSSADTVGI